MNREQLNEIYQALDSNAKELCNALKNGDNPLECSYGYYNGHYFKNEDNIYEIDYFPIPVITVNGYCDIEIGLEEVTVSAKLKKQQALVFDYSLLSDYYFEVYGVDNYLTDYYVKGNTINTLITNIEASNEQEIGFSFSFNKHQLKELYEFILFLKKHQFFY